MSLAKLKEIAESNNIKYAKNASAAKMVELLRESGIPVTDSYAEEKQEPKASSQEFDDNPIASSYSRGNESHDLAYDFRFIEKKYRELARNKSDPDRELKFNMLKKDKDALKIKARDTTLFRKILEWERSRRMINVPDEYALNKIEADEINYNCICRQKMAAGRKVKVGQSCKYKTYFDESRGADIYIVYTERIVEPDEQITRELDRKMKLGFMPSEDDFLPPKSLWHRFTLVDREFLTYFEITEE